MPGGWVLVAIGILLATHLVALGYAIHKARNRAAARGEGVEAGKSGLACPNCGVDNEPSYRFCRQCVEELPTGVSFVDDSGRAESPDAVTPFVLERPTAPKR